MSEKIGLIHRPPEADIRRGVHFKLLPETHACLRVLCLRRGISMQELIEELAQLVVNEDPLVQTIVDNLVERKKSRYFERLSATDAESLFDVIAHESPLK